MSCLVKNGFSIFRHSGEKYTTAAATTLQHSLKHDLGKAVKSPSNWYCEGIDMDNGTPKTKGFPYIRARFIIHKFEFWIVGSRSAIYAGLTI